MQSGVLLRITGKVQGVGFRPFIWQLAGQLGLRGEVFNDSNGVEVRLLLPADIATLLHIILNDGPPMAKIHDISQLSFSWLQPPDHFTILQSRPGNMQTQVVPDAATCSRCVDEMNDPDNVRYRYPFINCTHCGPRFSIILRMPYDRSSTSMAAFPLCSRCLTEYVSPQNRRFHAQPIACPDCGPVVRSVEAGKTGDGYGERAIGRAVKALQAGLIVAIKGIGGFHLACDATQDEAVSRLRTRKKRPTKPFAVMVPDSNWLARCTGSPDLTPLLAHLKSSASPVVLTPKHPGSPLSKGVAPGLGETGIMFPSNPLQHILMQAVAIPLVMTSGNTTGNATVLTNQQALESLKDIADVWLLHDRDILQRADDSVIRLSASGPEMLRRARGYSPDALPLPPGFTHQSPLLAVGGDLKNTFCLVSGKTAILSPHQGDPAGDEDRQRWQTAVSQFTSLYHCQPQWLAGDAHPRYFTHQWASCQSLPFTPVLHHHAHLAACLGEHYWPVTGGPVIGLALDGIGYGQEGQWWGGECFLFDYCRCRHLGGLPPVALPGGDKAARQPWRNQLAHFARFVPRWQEHPRAAPLLKHPWKPVLTAANAGINSPLASSCGRLFDAAASALQCAPGEQSWEGEAACQLESLARQAAPFHHGVAMPVTDNQLDLGTFWSGWLALQVSPAQQAWAFHDVLAQGFAEMAKKFAGEYGIHHVALSGGVLSNTLLKNRLLYHLSPLQVFTHQQLPAGDGGLSYGQALVACAQRSRISSGNSVSTGDDENAPLLS